LVARKAMKSELKLGYFPSLLGGVHARWAPLLLEPIVGSPERFVIGCVAIGESGYHIEIANAVDRLACLYGKQGLHLVQVIEQSRNWLASDLAQRGGAVFENPRLPFESLSFGEVRRGYGSSLASISADWMSALSSLYVKDTYSEIVPYSYSEAPVVAISKKISEPLPLSVLQIVAQKDVRLLQFFSEDVKEGRRRRRSYGSHEILIDFSGNRLVANFASLDVGRLSPSVGNVKQRLWDLKVERDANFRRGKRIEHELIIRVPTVDEVPVTQRAKLNLQKAYKGLEEQADHEELRLMPFSSVAEIGDHLLKREAA